LPAVRARNPAVRTAAGRIGIQSPQSPVGLFGLMWMSMMLSIRVRCLDGNSFCRLGRLCGGS
jgi:hypothetical protein